MSGKSGTAPNTSVVLTAAEIEFIKRHYGGRKSAAIHRALELLMAATVADLQRGVQEPKDRAVGE